MAIKSTRGAKIFEGANTVIMAMLTIIIIYPFWNLLVESRN